MDKAKILLQKIAKGIDPLTGEIVPEESFLNDPGVIRCFYFLIDVLDYTASGAYDKPGWRMARFCITPEQKNKVRFVSPRTGVNEFAKCVNMCIDPCRSKKLTGVVLNKGLKRMGILGEAITADGKKRTVANEKSFDFGFETEKRVYNGIEYEMVVINEKGRKFLLDNLESIMGEDGASPDSGHH